MEPEADRRGGASWRDSLIRLPSIWPLVIAFVFMAVAFPTIMAVLSLAPGGSTDDMPIEARVVSGLAFATFMTLAFLVLSRKQFRAMRASTPEQRIQIARSLRTGRLPDDQGLDPVVAPLAARTRDQARANAITSPIIFGFFAVLGAGVAIGTQTWWYVIPAVGFVAAAIAAVVSSRRSQDRMAALEWAIDERTPNASGAIAPG